MRKSQRHHVQYSFYTTVYAPMLSNNLAAVLVVSVSLTRSGTQDPLNETAVRLLPVGVTRAVSNKPLYFL